MSNVLEAVVLRDKILQLEAQIISAISELEKVLGVRLEEFNPGDAAAIKKYLDEKIYAKN